VTLDNEVYCETVKICRFSSKYWFFCTKFVHRAVAGKGCAPHLKKECNKLDLTVAQYWLADHNDWSRCFAISSSHVYFLVTVLLVGLLKKRAKLRHLILLSEWHTEHRWRRSKDWNGRIGLSTWSSKQSSPPRFTCSLLRHQQTGQGRAGALSRISSYTNCEFKVDYEKESATYHVWFREKRFKWKILDWNGRIGL
jgi:hypothetical protein